MLVCLLKRAVLRTALRLNMLALSAVGTFASSYLPVRIMRHILVKGEEAFHGRNPIEILEVCVKPKTSLPHSGFLWHFLYYSTCPKATVWLLLQRQRPKMRIACLQFAPLVGDIETNINRADAILGKANPKDLDLLVLPEMAFSGEP